MKTISVSEFEQKFDDGEDVSDYIDWSKARRPNQELTHVDFDMPVWALRDLDQEAERLGMTRQALIARWIAERLEATRQSR